MSEEIILLSYNIHKGFSGRRRIFVLDAMRDAIRQTGADLIFLQEVIGEHAAYKESHVNWPEEEQFEYLADNVWPHSAYGQNAVYNEGHHGNAILSKFPIVCHNNFDISTGPAEPRGVLHCRIALPKTELDCYCTHLGLVAKMRRFQFDKMCDWVNEISGADAPVLVGGDFNDWCRGACGVLSERLQLRDAYRNLHGRLPRTFPSWFPFLQLDRVYSRGLRVKTARVLGGKPWSTLSDHAPLLVSFDV